MAHVKCKRKGVSTSEYRSLILDAQGVFMTTHPNSLAVQPAPCDMLPLTTTRTHQTYLCISSEYNNTNIPIIRESLINYEQAVA